MCVDKLLYHASKIVVESIQSARADHRPQPGMVQSIVIYLLAAQGHEQAAVEAFVLEGRLLDGDEVGRRCSFQQY